MLTQPRRVFFLILLMKWLKFQTFSELANYHHNGSFSTPDQRSVATFLLSGTTKNYAQYPERNDEDFDMDTTQGGEQEEQEDDGEEVPHTQITIVNERDLEGGLHHPQCDIIW